MNDKAVLVTIIVILSAILLFLIREIYKARRGETTLMVDILNRLGQAPNRSSNHRQQNHVSQTRAQMNNSAVAPRARTEVRTPAPSRPNPVNRPAPTPSVNNTATETGTMVYFANDRHGQIDREYRFKYKKVGNGWRAYILRTPSFGVRNTGSGIIHRLTDNNGQFYICWDRQVDTLKDMQTISRHWADSIQEYIATGRFTTS